MSKPVLGYWNIRGYGQHLRLALRYLDVDYEDKEYTFGPAPEFSAENWFSEKFTHGLDFPNLPYFKDGNFKLTSSRAILLYVMKKYGKNMVPEELDRFATAEMIIGQLDDVLKILGNLSYGRRIAWMKTDLTLDEATAKPFQYLANYLGDNPWILGANISYVDFFMYEVLKKFKKYRTDFLKNESRLEAYIHRFEEIPKLKDYIISTENLPCFSPYAVLQY